MKNDKNKIIRLVLACVCLLITLFCVVYLGKYFMEIRQSQNGVNALKGLIIEEVDSSTSEENTADIQLVEVNGRMVQKKYAELYRENPHFIGWITIPDTKVDYPVMQNMEENEYYINRNFEQEWDGSGLPFMDIQCSFSEPTANQIIYGHNMKSGTMFAGILKYDSQEFYEKHKTITFNTIEADGEYEVIAAFYSQVYDESDTLHFKYYQFFDTDSEEEFNEFVEQVKALTPYEIEATASYGDTLITLSTCAYNTENGRFAVVARKIE
ncbi:MAG: class B sortase [Lachnospiraceae bacterium]|nr:class B sortase [Lachnospiraceae bacterium]